jgi:hypothetical protein
MSEPVPRACFRKTDAPFSPAGDLWWEYSNGRVAFGSQADTTFVTPAGHGQVMIGIQGGPPGNNQAIFFLTRQP